MAIEARQPSRESAMQLRLPLANSAEMLEDVKAGMRVEPNRFRRYFTGPLEGKTPASEVIAEEKPKSGRMEGFQSDFLPKPMPSDLYSGGEWLLE